jgi:hypothetical protein
MQYFKKSLLIMSTGNPSKIVMVIRSAKDESVILGGL